MKIFFIDPVCPKPYTLKTLATEPMGGTEATVLRVAKALVRFGSIVSIKQRNRDAPVRDSNLVYDTLANGGSPDVCITLRDIGEYLKATKDYPEASHFLWLHDVLSGQYTDHFKFHLKDYTGPTIQVIAVSEWHKNNILSQLYEEVVAKKIQVRTIYNPVALARRPNQKVDKSKLVFFSSPHKGLDYTLELFKALKYDSDDSKYKLYIANPGYYESKNIDIKNVINLGSLTHTQIINHVREALCVLYTQPIFEETFGLVMAEANAVGTPVLAHRLGASTEVLKHPDQLIDGTNPKAIEERLESWYNGYRPIVRCHDQFELDEVIKEWRKLIKC